MKKLVIGIFALFIIAFAFLSFKPKKPRLQPSVNATLNGVLESTAITMISNFAKNYGNDFSAKSVSAWYSEKQIEAINALLMTEHNNINIGSDGVRFYFGSQNPIGTNTKLKVKIFLVSTKPQATGGDPTISAHGDYYSHAATFLNIETGIAVNNNGSQIMNQGGLLYNTKPPIDGACTNPGTHFLPGGVAYQWVQTRYENGPKKDTSPYNTRSEWFSYCFINALFNVITNPNFSFSGLRIYLGKGFKDESGKIRDVIILVPTQSVGKINGDYYNCLEDLAPGTFCNEKANLLKLLKHRPVPYIDDGSGYDEGELCPDVCNDSSTTNLKIKKSKK